MTSSEDYLFHTTRSRSSLRNILGSGYLRPTAGSLSFTHDPQFGLSVSMSGYTFVYPTDVIYSIYQGRDIDYDVDRRFRGQGKEEEEVEVFQPVLVSDAIEILPAIAAARKYATGYKYHYKDVRELKKLPGPGHFFRGR